MKFIFEKRASIIIHNFIKAQRVDKPFILPSNICPIVPSIFLKLNRQILFVDIDLKNLEIDQDMLINLLKDNLGKFGGILWTNGLGSNHSNEVLFKILKSIDPNLLLIDDRCLCKPSFEFRSKFSDLVVFSSGYGKYTDLDYGGFALMKKEHKYISYNIKFDAKDHENLVNSFHKAINNELKICYKDSNWLGSNKSNLNYNLYKKEVLKLAKKSSNHKTKLNKIYSKNIYKKAQMPLKLCHWRFNILVNNKKILLKKIFLKGLFASSHYYPSSKLFGHTNCVKSTKISNHIINLFNDFRFNEDMAISICEIINKHIKVYGVPKIK